GSFFFQAEDGIRDRNVTGVQTCALPIFMPHTTEGFAGICGEINGRVGSLGFWAVSGATAATMTPHRTPKRQVNFIPSSFGFSRYSAATSNKAYRDTALASRWQWQRLCLQ